MKSLPPDPRRVCYCPPPSPRRPLCVEVSQYSSILATFPSKVKKKKKKKKEEEGEEEEWKC